jgi:hypothetical protein
MTQRSLSALRIGNFKAFADTQRIPLKPITLIFGPNSAGKSSIIQSLAFAHEVEFGEDAKGGARFDVQTTRLGGRSINLGGFRQFVHRGDARRRVEWGLDLDLADCGERLRERMPDAKRLSMTIEIGIELDDQDRARRGAAPRLEALGIAVDDTELMHLSHRRSDANGTVLRIDRLVADHPVVRQLATAVIEGYTTTAALADDDFHVIAAATNCLLPKIEVLAPRLFPLSVLVEKEPAATRAAAAALVAVSRSNRKDDVARALDIHLPVLLEDVFKLLNGEIEGQLQRLRYLGPVREQPARHIAFSEERDSNWQAGGAFAWDVLARDAAVRERVNQWLAGHPGLTRQEVAAAVMQRDRQMLHDEWMKTPYRLFVDRHVAMADLRDALVSAFYEKPLTLLERRELLTKDLTTVFAALQEQYETDQARAEEYAKELQPWIERIQVATSAAERERLTAEAMTHFEAVEARKLEGPEAQWEMYQEQMADDAPLEEAQARTAEFMTALDKQGISDITELRLWDADKKVAMSVCDVGFGISQVLPVLTLAYGSSGDLIAIEQPEIHLHPALQAELADVFIESALGEPHNTFLLETHSEHLILRLLRRIREKKLSPADMCVLFVEPIDRGSKITELEYDEDGDFIDEWPGGFFEESFREKFAGR